MVDTFKMMNKIRLVKFVNVSDEDLLINNDVNNQSVIAELYCRHFKMWLTIANKPKFAYVDKADKSSFVLQGLYDAIQNYSYDKQVQFKTFAYRCVNNALVGVMLKSKKHDNWLQRNDVSLDSLIELNDGNPYELNFDVPADDELSNVDLICMINSSDFTDREKLLCRAIMEDPYISDIELSEILKVHRHTVRTDKIKLRSKLAMLYNA